MNSMRIWPLIEAFASAVACSRAHVEPRKSIDNKSERSKRQARASFTRYSAEPASMDLRDLYGRLCTR